MIGYVAMWKFTLIAYIHNIAILGISHTMYSVKYYTIPSQFHTMWHIEKTIKIYHLFSAALHGVFLSQQHHQCSCAQNQSLQCGDHWLLI